MRSFYRNRWFSLLLAASVLLSALLPAAAAKGGNMTIAGVDLGYAPGDCYPDSEENMALTGSVQCMAFARYCQSAVYGVNDYNAPEQFRDIVGRRAPSECTVENLKKWFMGCAPATHLRCPGGSRSMHSMAIAETNEDTVHVIHGNWYPGNIVAETYWTWEKFADQVQTRGGIEYATSYIGRLPEPSETAVRLPTTLPTAPTTTRLPFVDGDLIEDLPAGDVNGDGKVNTRDARLALRFAARLESLNAAQVAAADTDANGRVTSADARRILRAAAKLETLE